MKKHWKAIVPSGNCLESEREFAMKTSFRVLPWHITLGILFYQSHPSVFPFLFFYFGCGGKPSILRGNSKIESLRYSASHCFSHK